MVAHGSANEIETLLKNSCKIDEALAVDTSQAYSILKTLGDYYITTNYDQHFDVLFRDENRVYEPAELCNLGKKGLSLSKDKLYHIHGSLANVNSIVLTHDNYLERYSNRYYIEFLRKIFCDYNVLFISYGLDEWDLSNILRTLKNKGACNDHFLLKNYYIDEFDDFSYDLKQFNDYNVRVVSYLRDLNDFKELFNVIKSWTNAINEMELDLR